MEALLFVVFVWYAINTHRQIRLLEEIADKMAMGHTISENTLLTHVDVGIIKRKLLDDDE